MRKLIYICAEVAKVPRTNISVEDRIAKELADQAKLTNKTLYALANECLEAMIAICRQGGTPQEAFPAWRLSKMLKEVDAVPIPGSLLEKMIRRLFELDREGLQQAWFEQGQRIGTYLQMFYQDLEQLLSAAREFEGLMPIKRLDVKKTDRGGRPQYVLRVVGAGLSAEATTCAQHIIAGVLSAYSWAIKSSKVSEGMLELELEKGQGP